MAMVAMATAAGSAAIVAAAVAMAGLTVVAGAVTAVMETATGRQNGNAGRRQQPDGISDSSNGNCSAAMAPFQQWQRRPRDGSDGTIVSNGSDGAAMAVMAWGWQ